MYSEKKLNEQYCSYLKKEIKAPEILNLFARLT